MAGEVLVGRIYDDAAGGGRAVRVLADRLWPRGVTKARAALDEWCKEVAPSHELRSDHDHDHDPERCRAGLAVGERAAALAHLRALGRDRPLMLLTAAKDVGVSHITVLAGD